jgi:hypothetical protein
MCEAPEEDGQAAGGFTSEDGHVERVYGAGRADEKGLPTSPEDCRSMDWVSELGFLGYGRSGLRFGRGGGTTNESAAGRTERTV